jgi:DNA-binding transcriptional MerR regulator
MDDTPAYNLKAVVRETGLKPDTLRAWERRYGLPAPNRSVGGHRLYSDRDIQVLKWLVTRQRAGMSISRAVELWQRLSELGQDPTRMPEYSAPVSILPSLSTGHQLEDLRASWLDACLAFDEPGAEAALTQALALYPVESVCFGLLIPGLAEVGDRWYRDEASPQQEHFASALAERRIESLLAAAPGPVRQSRVLVACPPGEQHTFVPLLLTLLLRRRGWGVTYLGADVPLAQFEHALESIRPQLCVMSAQTLHAATQMLPMAELLQARGLPLAFGGFAFGDRPVLQQILPGHFLGDQLEAALEAIEGLLTSPRAASPARPIAAEISALLPVFRQHRPSIDAQLQRDLPPAALPPEQLDTAIEYLGQAIGDGLTLGDLDLAASEVTWVEGMLAHARIPAHRLTSFLSAYRRAVAENLGPQGKPIVDWLAGLIPPGSSD